MRIESIVPAAQVLDGRNRRSWTALAFAAGYVNATAFLSCARFTTHVTGILTHAGTHAPDIFASEGGFASHWALFAEYAAVFVSFVIGAMTAVLILDSRRVRGLRALPWLPLATVATLLASCAVLGHFGVFGRFGGESESDRSFELLWILAFAMGLQNASIANATGSLVRTTHMTGPATDLGVALAFLILRETPENVRRAARQTLALRASKIVGFTVGAAAAAFAAPYLGFLGFLVPAVTCGAIAVRVFASRTRLDGLAGREALTDG